MLSASDRAGKAHLRSHSGAFAGVAFHGAPTAAEYAVPAPLFQTLVKERLRLPLDITEARCEGCNTALDAYGWHRSACPRSGRVKARASAPGRALAKVCREAGAQVRTNQLLRDLNVGVGGSDGRRIEVVANGLSCYHGAQLAVDITLRCALSADGAPQASAADVDGAVANGARADKERTYPELVAGRRCRLVVVGVETGGRFSDEAVSFLEALAKERAADTTPLLRRAAERNWLRRWARTLGVACATAYATSLVSPTSRSDCVGGGTSNGCSPCLEQLFGECRAGVGEGFVVAHTALRGEPGAPASCGLGVGACGGGFSHSAGGVREGASVGVSAAAAAAAAL